MRGNIKAESRPLDIANSSFFRPWDHRIGTLGGDVDILWEFGLDLSGESASYPNEVDYAFNHKHMTFSLDFRQSNILQRTASGEETLKTLPCEATAAAYDGRGKLGLLSSSGIYVLDIETDEITQAAFDNSRLRANAIGILPDGFFAISPAGIMLCVRGSLLEEVAIPTISGISGVARCEITGRIAITSAEEDKFFILDKTFSIMHEYGGALDRDGTALLLHAPRGCAYRNGRLAVCDTNNNRILIFNEHFAPPDIIGDPAGGPSSRFWRPVNPNWSCDDILTIADSKNRRAVTIDQASHEAEQNIGGIKRLLSLPRSAVPQPNGSLLIADCHNNRVLSLMPEIGWWRTMLTDISWPRHAWTTSSQTLRVLSGLPPYNLFFSGRLDAMLAEEDWTSRHSLRDPHQYAENVWGKALVVNTGRHEIIVNEARFQQIKVLCGQALDDPHSAAVSATGSILICDTGNNRLLWSDRFGENWRQINEIKLPDGSVMPLSGPRHVQFTSDDTAIVIDTGSRSVSMINLNGSARWIIGPTRFLDSTPHDLYIWGNSLFHDPRWAHYKDGILIVSDTGNCRVLAFNMRAFRNNPQI